MATPILTPDQVRLYIQDKAENNHLLDTEEFSDIQINMAIDLAISEFNLIPPLSMFSSKNFPSQFVALIMSGTLGKLYSGAAALLARNHMEYSDGGLTVPVEERMQLYTSLAEMYNQYFNQTANKVKIYLNIEDGWGEVSSDEAGFPIW